MATAIADTIYTNYVALCVKQTKLNHLDPSKLLRNEERGTKAAPKPTTDALERPPNNTYKVHSSTAVWTQFKTKIVRECMVYRGIVTANPVEMKIQKVLQKGSKLKNELSLLRCYLNSLFGFLFGFVSP
jgi:hypothetical protein